MLTTAIAKNTLLQTAGKILSIILGWTTILAMTNYLGATVFGSYTIMTAYLQFFAVSADLGMVLVTSQLLAEHPNKQETIFANLFTFRLVTAGGLLAIAPIAVWLLPYSLVVKQGVVILSLSFFLIALLQVFTGLFQKELHMGPAVAGELLGRVALLATVGVAIWQGWGILAIAGGVVLASAINIALVFAWSRSFVRVRLAFDTAIWKTIWQRSWPIAAGIFFNLIYLKADTLILSFVRSEAEVGVYGAMFRIFEVLITFPTMFASLLLPVMAAAWVKKDYAGVQQMAQQALTILLYAAVPMVIGVLFTAPRLVALFGNEFAATGTPVLILLVIATAAVFVGTLLGHVVVAVHLQRKLLWLYAITAFVSLGAYLIIIPIYGAIGAAAMTVVAELIILVLLLIALRRTVKFRFSFKPVGTAITASVPMFLFLIISSAWHISIVVTVSGTLYLSALYYLGAVPINFVQTIFSSRKQKTRQA